MNPLKASCISDNLPIITTLRDHLPGSARAVWRDMGDQTFIIDFTLSCLQPTKHMGKHNYDAGFRKQFEFLDPPKEVVASYTQETKFAVIPTICPFCMHQIASYAKPSLHSAIVFRHVTSPKYTKYNFPILQAETKDTEHSTAL